MPLSIAGALFLVSQGVIQNLSRYLVATGPTHLTQTIAMGPVASQEPIKLLSGVLDCTAPTCRARSGGSESPGLRCSWARAPPAATVVSTREIKLAVLGTLFVPILSLIMTAVASATKAGRASIDTGIAHGPQGFSETLYDYLSQANNNGSAFAGYTGFIQPSSGNVGAHGIVFADVAGGLVMTFGRFVPILFVLALGGALAGCRVSPAGLGTLRTDTPTFIGFMIAFVVIFALLNFLAALFIGPLDQSLTGHLY